MNVSFLCNIYTSCGGTGTQYDYILYNAYLYPFILLLANRELIIIGYQYFQTFYLKQYTLACPNYAWSPTFWR